MKSLHVVEKQHKTSFICLLELVEPNCFFVFSRMEVASKVVGILYKRP